MKLFVGVKKGETDGTVRYGFTLYSDTGAVLQTGTKVVPKPELMLEPHLDVIQWVVVRLNALVENRKLEEDEKIILFMEKKTVYNWFKNDKAPTDYVIKYGDVMNEIAYVRNHLELVQSDSVQKKVIYKEKSHSDVEKASDWLNGFKE